MSSGALAAVFVWLAVQTDPLILRARRVIEVESGRAIEPGEIAVAEGRIQERAPEGASVLELGDLTLLPGLVDAHVHLVLGGEAEANARATALAGFTTVQDLGAVAYRNLPLRDRIEAGALVGPRVIASGPWLGIAGGICDFGGIGVRGADAFRKRVREDVARGADLIKVCVTGWLEAAFREPDKQEVSKEELSAAIEEAHLLGRRVAVHALSESGIETAVALGADLVVHGGFPSPSTVEKMRTRHVFQISTLSSLPAGAALESLRAHLRRSASLGLPLAFGTDAGVIPHGTNAGEFAELVAIGLTKAEAIRAATVHAARAVGLEGRVGTLRPGAYADVIGVEGNPLEDLEALSRVKFVMKGGLILKAP